MAARPDAIVAADGELLTHEWVVDYKLDANGQVDPDTIVTEQEAVRAIVSKPTEEGEERLEGRLSTGSLKLTVPTDRDVQANRGGRRDRFHRPARTGWGEGGWGDGVWGGSESNVRSSKVVGWGDDGWGDGVWGGSESNVRSYKVVEVQDDRNPFTGTGKQTVFIDRLGGHHVPE